MGTIVVGDGPTCQLLGRSQRRTDGDTRLPEITAQVTRDFGR
jgi:hypothetical protein